MHRRPALLATLLLSLCVLAAGVAAALLDGGGDDDRGPTASTGLAGSTLPPLRDDQVRVTGTLAGAEIDGLLGAPVPLPLTVEAAGGGAGGGEIRGVAVEGGGTTIVWDGGRSLLLSGTGSLELDTARFSFDGSFLRVQLGGATHALTVGGYRIDTPVAVDTEGGAEPRDAVTFSIEAAGATFRATGDVSANLAAPPGTTFDLTGPGRVVLDGSLEVERPEGGEPAARVELASGSYTLTLAPQDDGNWTVLALLQGEVTST